jgi:hypothetical protein
MFFSNSPASTWTVNDQGLTVRIPTPKDYQRAVSGQGPTEYRMMTVSFELLLSDADSGAEPVDDGVFLPTASAVRLDAESRSLLGVPPVYSGQFELSTGGPPHFPQFAPKLLLIPPDSGRATGQYERKGPALKCNGKWWLLSEGQLALFTSMEEWKNIPSPSERDNLTLLAKLRAIRDHGIPIDLGAYGDRARVHASTGLNIVAQRNSITGEVSLLPVPEGEFENLPSKDVQNRTSQIEGKEPTAVLRVGSTIVVMTEEQTILARKILQRPKVPASEVARFLQDPQRWIDEVVYRDMDIEFGPRVIGIGEWEGGYFGAGGHQPGDWLDGAEPAEPTKKPAKKATKDDDEDGTKSSFVAQVIEKNDDRDDYVEVAPATAPPRLIGEWAPSRPLKRLLLPHQQRAVEWLYENTIHTVAGPNPDANVNVRRGLLLADDMGLGKTMSTLAFISEWNHAFAHENKGPAPAALVVAPLSLLENWKQEIESTFSDPAALFTRVLLAHGRQVATVEKSPGSRDMVSDVDSTKDAVCGLMIGTGTERSLDMPGSIVLTTYETLRSYRFSFGKAEWGCVILDEAQTIKNPAARVTCVAKSLKARVRIALTGTPVENSLADLWSLMDFITPGKLKPFQEFRREWMLPLLQPTLSPEEKGRMGRALRQEINDVFLRRMKTEELKGLPQKTLRPLQFPMNQAQAQIYAELVTRIKAERQGWNSKEVQVRTIDALHRLRKITLHPGLHDDQRDKWFSAGSVKESRAFLSQSSKLEWLLGILDDIKRANEKALVFCITKDLQSLLKHHLSLIFGVSVPVINGDTKSRETSNPQMETRLGLIDKFTKTEGYALAVLSPIAAGVGLNIVAANHVIHLERHWNPAKEDQATDRAYRIGQQKPVNVYLPVATHPSMKSFDLVLDNVIARKRGLQMSLGLIPVPETTESELLGEILED